MTILREIDWRGRRREYAGRVAGDRFPLIGGDEIWLPLLGRGGRADVYAAPGDPGKIMRYASVADQFLDYALLLAANPPADSAKAPRIHDLVLIDGIGCACLIDRMQPAPQDDVVEIRKYLLDEVDLRHVPTRLRADAEALKGLVDWLRGHVGHHDFDYVEVNFMVGDAGLVLNDPLPGLSWRDGVAGLLEQARQTGRYPSLAASVPVMTEPVPAVEAMAPGV